MKNQLVKILMVAFIIISVFSCKKETPSLWATYKPENGLIDKSVNAIAIDLQGNK